MTANELIEDAVLRIGEVYEVNGRNGLPPFSLSE